MTQDPPCTETHDSASKCHQCERAACIAAAETYWEKTWCGENYVICTDPDHPCQCRNKLIAALRKVQP